MGDKQQAATFPTPPPFYKHFTTANLQQLQQPRHKQSIEENDSPESNVLQLLPELRYLIPPQPPADGKWRTFGYEHDLNAPEPSIEEAGVEKLYPDHPSIKLAPQAHLIALARSLLASFLSTVGVLATNPGMYEQKIKDLRAMVFNMHDLINQYRPHQARESLILMMEEHVDQLRQEIRAIGEIKDKVQSSLDEIHLAKDVSVAFGDDTKIDKEPMLDDRRIRQQNAWKLLQGLDEAQPDEQTTEAVEAG